MRTTKFINTLVAGISLIGLGMVGMYIARLLIIFLARHIAIAVPYVIILALCLYIIKKNWRNK